MRDKPDYCYSSGCPLATKGRGFALGCGDPTTAKIGILFERPADEEINYTMGGPKPLAMGEEGFKELKKWQADELTRRETAFPELNTPEQRRFLVRGAPVRGMSGAELRTWVLPTTGGGLLENFFLENVLHCAGKDNSYPTGDERIAAEGCCAHWSRLAPPIPSNRGPDFEPQASIVSLHPAGLLRDTGGGIVALPLQIDTFTKASSFIKDGAGKILILAGGKASKYWLGYAEAVTRWCGHFILETRTTWQRRLERWNQGVAMIPTLGLKKSRKKKVKEGSPDQGPPSTSSPRRSRKKAPEIPGMAALGM